MGSLSEQYAIEAKRIDNIIYQKIKTALEFDIHDKDEIAFDDKKMEKLFRKVEDRKASVLALFEGSFSENEELLRPKIERRQNKKITVRTDKYTKLANKILKARIDAVIDEFISSENATAMQTSIGIDRKTFIGAVLDSNIEVQLEQRKIVEEEKEER